MRQSSFRANLCVRKAKNGRSFHAQKVGEVICQKWRSYDPYDREFTIVERDGISLHFHVAEGHRVCWISVNNIEALYQQYLPTGAIQSPLTSQPWGMKGFFLCDPFRNLLLFGESIPEEESRTQQGA